MTSTPIGSRPQLKVPGPLQEFAVVRELLRPQEDSHSEKDSEGSPASSVELTGQVLDAHDGRPLSDANVRISWEGKHPFEERREVNLRSDGTFVTPPLSVRSCFAIEIQSEGYLRFDEELVADPGADMRIEMRRAGSIRGIVRDTAGIPIAGCTVTLARDTGEWDDSDNEKQTDAEGTFLYGRVPLPAVCWLRVTDDKGRRASSLIHLTNSSPVAEIELEVDELGLIVPIRVKSPIGSPLPQIPIWWELVGEEWWDWQFGGLTDFSGEVSLCLPCRGTYWIRTGDWRSQQPHVRVKVESAQSCPVVLQFHQETSVDGYVVATDGTPVGQVEVILWIGPREGPCLFSSHQSSDRDGRFRFDGVPLGLDATLRAERRGFLPLEIRIHTGRNPVSCTVEKAPLLRFRLDSTFEEQRVHLYFQTIHGSRHRESANVRPSGIVSVPVEHCEVPFDLVIRVAGTSPRLVEGLCLARGRELDLGKIQLERSPRLSGVVLCPDGSPASGAQVHYATDSVGWIESYYTDEDGRFEFGVLANAQATLSAYWRDEGVASFEATRAVSSSGRFGSNTLLLVREPVGWVRGQILGAEGPALWGLNLQDLQERNSFWVGRSNRSGRFKIECDPGRYQVLFRPFGSWKWMHGPEVEVIADQATSIRLTPSEVEPLLEPR